MVGGRGIFTSGIFVSARLIPSKYLNPSATQMDMIRLEIRKPGLVMEMSVELRI